MNTLDIVKAFEEYNEILYRFIFLRVNKNKEIAQDLTQEVFLKAWEKRSSFDGDKSSIKTWLFTIAKNNVIDFYRKHKDLNISETVEVESKDSLEKDYEKESLFDYTMKAMKFLNKDEQELLTMRYVSDLDIKEISVIIKKNYNTTKVSIHRALNKLKDIINNESN